MIEGWNPILKSYKWTWVMGPMLMPLYDIYVISIVPYQCHVGFYFITSFARPLLTRVSSSSSFSGSLRLSNSKTKGNERSRLTTFRRLAVCVDTIQQDDPAALSFSFPFFWVCQHSPERYCFSLGMSGLTDYPVNFACARLMCPSVIHMMPFILLASQCVAGAQLFARSGSRQIWSTTLNARLLGQMAASRKERRAPGVGYMDCHKIRQKYRSNAPSDEKWQRKKRKIGHIAFMIRWFKLQLTVTTRAVLFFFILATA